MRVVRFLEVRDGVFRYQEGAAGIDLMHQIEAAHIGVGHRRALDRTGVVDDDVEAAKARDGLFDRTLNLRLFAHIDHQRQRLAAGFADFLGRGEDRARQFRVRLVGLGRDGNVRAVACGAQRNRQPDAARGAGDE